MNKKMMFLAPGMILGAVVMAAEPQISLESDQVESRFNIGRQQLNFETGEQMKKANELVQTGVVGGDDTLFDAAIKDYIEMAADTDSYRTFLQRLGKMKNYEQQLCYAYAVLLVMYKRININLKH